MTGFDCRPDDARADPTDDVDLPGGLERIECVECGHGVVTNNPDDVDRCVGCRGSG